MISQYNRDLRSPQANPAHRLRAVVGLGRLEHARGVRAQLDDSAVLGASEADEAIKVLTLAMWNMESGEEVLRAEAAHSLGQIGGLEAARKLLKRLHSLYVDHLDPGETPGVRAALAGALAHTLDSATLQKLKQRWEDYEKLSEVCLELLPALEQSQEASFVAALVLALARMALCMVDEWPVEEMPAALLRALLTAPEPRCSLAAVAAVLTINRVNEEISSQNIAAVFERLGAARGKPYSPQEIKSLLNSAAVYESILSDAQVANEKFWELMN